MVAVAFGTIIALIFVAVGSGILSWTAVNFVYAFLSRRWPQVVGTVVVSDLQRSRDSEGGYSYRPEVSYRYSVDGQELVANRTCFGDRLELSWSAPAVRAVRRYPAGASVAVHYDPDDPGDAVLEPGINGLLFAGAAFGGVFTVLGVLALRSSV